MSKKQIFVLATAIGIFALLYFGGRTKPNHKDGGSQAEEIVKIDAETVLSQSKKAIDSTARIEIAGIEATLAAVRTPEDEIKTLKNLSQRWNKLEQFGAGAIYAQQVAERENTPTSWSMAGTTYGICANRTQDMSVKVFACEEGLKAFDKALALAPDYADYKINKALLIIELSSANGSMPMEGITLLKDVVQKDPTNVAALLHLGRFSMQSGQFDKAIERLQAIIALPNATREDKLESYYLLFESYKNSDRSPQAADALKNAIKLADGEVKAALQEELSKM